MKIYQPSKDETAFLYQQAFELEPLVKTLGSLAVLVEETDGKDFAVTFVVAPETMKFKVRGTGPNLVEATIAAKDEARRQLNALVNLTPNDSEGKPLWLH